MFFRKKSRIEDDLLLVVGLGNPGKNYAQTRHNCGFMAVDLLADRYQGRWQKTRFNAESCRIVIGDTPVLLVKPQTFMNLSGDAVSLFQKYYKLESSRILVIYDDVDVKLGQIRIREQGGAGSHNGMKSLRQRIGSDFPRIRVGIGPQPNFIDIIDYVLGKFPSEDQPLITEAIEKAADAVELIAKQDIQTAMNRLNQRNAGGEP